MEPIPPELFLEPYPPAMRALAEDLRSIVCAVMPDAIERVRIGWRVIGYDVPVGRGRRTVLFAFVWPEPRHVHLGFQYGVLMADPERVLQGAGITRRARWLTFTPGQRPNGEALAPLIRDAAVVARMPKGERLNRALDLEK